MIPFGNAQLTLVVAPQAALGGAFFRDLPWIIALAGSLLSVAAAALTERLVDRRRRAEELAGRLDRIAAENRRLYAEQRSIARTLQHALLPDTLPAPPGLELSARHVAGAAGLEIADDEQGTTRSSSAPVRPCSSSATSPAAASRRPRPWPPCASPCWRTPPRAASRRRCSASSPTSPVRASAASSPPCCARAWTSRATRCARQRRASTAAAAQRRRRRLPPARGRRSDRRGPCGELRAGLGTRAGGGEDRHLHRRPRRALGEPLDDGLARLRETASAADRRPDRLLAALVAELSLDERHEDDTAILALRWSD